MLQGCGHRGSPLHARLGLSKPRTTLSTSKASRLARLAPSLQALHLLRAPRRALQRVRCWSISRGWLSEAGSVQLFGGRASRPYAQMAQAWSLGELAHLAPSIRRRK